MLRRTEEIIDAVMAKVIALGGVVSGEHGIGVTKLKYLEPERVKELAPHRAEVNPGGLMNPGKLEDLAVLDQVFTPSFNLLELEARILQHGQLEALAKAIAHCVRCGKCKADCCVYHPARGMFFHPRTRTSPSARSSRRCSTTRSGSARRSSSSSRWLRRWRTTAPSATSARSPARSTSTRARCRCSSARSSQLAGYKQHQRRDARDARPTSTAARRRTNAAFHARLVRLGARASRGPAHRGAAPAGRRPAAPPTRCRVLRSPSPTAAGRDLGDVLPPCEQDLVLGWPAGADAAQVR